MKKMKTKRAILSAVACIVFINLFVNLFVNFAVADTCTITAEDPVYDSTTVDVGTTRSVSATFKCSTGTATATVSFVPDSSSLTAVTDSGASQYESVSISTSGVTKTFYMSASAAGSYGFYLKAMQQDGSSGQTSTNYIQYVNPTSLTMTLTEDPSSPPYYNATSAVGIVASITNQLSSAQTRNLTLWFSSGGSSFSVSGDPLTQTISLAGSATYQAIWNVTLTGLSGTQYAYIRLGDNTQAATITFTLTTTTTETTTTAPAGAGATTTVPATTTTTTIPPVEERHNVTSAAANANTTFTFSRADTLKVQEVTINPKSALSNVGVSVKESSLPSGATAPVAAATGKVYKYVELTKTGYYTDQDLNNAYIKFKVEKSWLTSNSINETTVALYRYYSSAWQKLATEKLSSDASYVYYQATSSGLSVFAVVGEIVGAATTTTGPATTTTVPFSIPETIGGVPTWIIGVIIVVVVVVVVILVLAKRGVIKLPFKLPAKLPFKLPIKLPGRLGGEKEVKEAKEAVREAGKNWKDLYGKYKKK